MQLTSTETVMYYAKQEAGKIQAILSQLNGTECDYNESKEKAVLVEIVVGRSQDIINVNGNVCIGYKVECHFNNGVVLPAGLFADYNNLPLPVEPRLAINYKKDI